MITDTKQKGRFQSETLREYGLSGGRIKALAEGVP